MSSKKLLTIIIADCATQTSIKDCFESVSNWSPRKIIVSNNPHFKEQLPQLEVSELVYCDTESICQLWEQGIRQSKTQWNLLISSREVVTGRLKSSIEKQIKNNYDIEELFNFRKKTIFLKKVLKYPLVWSDEFPSCLIFIPNLKKFTLKPGQYKSNSFLEGEIVRFGESNLSDCVSEVLRLSHVEADSIAKYSKEKNLAVLIFKLFFKSSLEFFDNLFFKKGIREGYEGFVFSMLNSAIPVLAFLGYYEKYFKEGKIIAENIDKIRNILIIKLGGAGDVILATPIIRNFKILIPQAKVHTLVLKDVGSLLDNNPYIESSSLIDFDPSDKEITRISNMFGSLEIDLVVNLQSTKFSTKLLKKIKSRWKVNRSYFFQDKNTDALIGFTDTYRSAIERDLDVLRSVGLNPVDKNTEVFLEKNEIEWAKKFFSINGLSGENKTVMIHPCSSLKIRSWGLENFAGLCQDLILKAHCQIIVNSSFEELESVQPIKNLAPGVCFFSGSLRELLSLINECDLFIGNDSGPSQFSVALNIPTITLNGPSVSSLYRDPDLVRGKHYTFNKEVFCRDIFHTQCMSKIDPVTNQPACDSMICLDFTIEEVAAKAYELLHVSGRGKQ